MRLESRWIGPAAADAPTLVVLDEPSSSQPWGAFPDSLARATGCGVCVCSRAGSGAPGPLTTPPADDSLVALSQALDAIGFSRGILIGYGEGAAIVTIYAGSIEDHRVRGLVLIAPPLIVDGEQGRDLRQSIGYIRVPILIVRGTLDRRCTMDQIDAARDEAYCPVDVGLIEGAGHAPHLERPGDTLAVVGGFVSTLFTTFGEGRSPEATRSEQPDHVRPA